MKLQVRLLTACCVLAFCAGPLLAGSYQGVVGIPFPGAQSDRGIAVNKNPGSPYYGYFYGVDSGGTFDATNFPGTGEQAVRIYAPDPAGAGTNAGAYVDTGSKLSYSTVPEGAVLMNTFVGEDDVVWVADWGSRRILTGPPDGSADGGNLTLQFETPINPRGIHVTGRLGETGTRVFVACYGTNPAQVNCEVWEWDGAAWQNIASLGNLGLARPFDVTVDADGNSYWMSSSSTGPFVKKVTPFLFEDVGWSFQKPSFMGGSWTPGSIEWVDDPQDSQNPEYLYVSAFFTTSVMRFDMQGNYIDGFGNTNGYNDPATPPAGTWTPLAFSGPGGNNTVWMTADDARNVYALVRYPGLTPVAYKVRLLQAAERVTGLVADNDVYGQIQLRWNESAGGPAAPTGYRILRGTSPGALTLYDEIDAYPKWKDAAQGTTSGGPFYYSVIAFNGSGEAAPSDVAGPITPSTSTAPAPGSKGVALSYSETNAADTLNNPGYNNSWQAAREFLDQRSIAYDVVYDAESPENEPAAEEDEIAGYRLLILALNRNMSHYMAQCIADYVKYSNGVVLSSYYNSIADHTGRREANYRLADVYRVDALNVGQGGSPFDTAAYYLLKPVPGAPEAGALFSGLTGDPFDGARQVNPITYLIGGYQDGTASQPGEWYLLDGTTPARQDPAQNKGIVIGYRTAARQSVQSVMLGANWWGQSTANIGSGGAGTMSADRLLQNVLQFLGVDIPMQPVYAESIGSARTRDDGEGAVFTDVIVTRTITLSGEGPWYIEEPDRSSGIRVINAPDLTEGQMVTLSGRLGRDDNGERYLTVFETLLGSTPGIPEALHIRSDRVGGSYITGGIGLDNTGLLVRVAGKLTETGVDDQANLYFRLDDGANVTYGNAAAPGIKVIGISPTPTLGQWVSAEGVIGTEISDEDVVPVIRMREYEAAIALDP